MRTSDSPPPHSECSFEGVLAPEVLDVLMTNAVHRHLEPGTLLFGQGDPADRFFLVRAGKVRLFTLEPGGGETVLHVFGAGDFFGLPAMLGLRHYPVNGEAVTRAEIDVVHRGALIARVEAEGGGRLMPLVSTLARRHRILTRSLAELKGVPPFQRVCLWLWRELQKAMPEAFGHPGGGPVSIPLAVPNYVIAGAVGLAPENFSRALKRLEPHGIRVRDGRLTVSDVCRLHALAIVRDDTVRKHSDGREKAGRQLTKRHGATRETRSG